jgi:rhodanese-related sulfurtransferase
LSVPEIDVEQLSGEVASGATVLDVREPHEWETGYVEGALLISMADVPEQVDELPDDEPIYVICAHGNRSAKVAEYLLRQGLDAHNVAGGMVAWSGAGKPVRRGAEQA